MEKDIYRGMERERERETLEKVRLRERVLN